MDPQDEVAEVAEEGGDGVDGGEEHVHVWELGGCLAGEEGGGVAFCGCDEGGDVCVDSVEVGHC